MKLRLFMLRARLRIWPQTRFALCITGGVIALIGVSVDGFYSVSAPFIRQIGPGQHTGIADSANGPVGTGLLAPVIGTYSAWNGPIHCWPVLSSIGAALAVGVVTYFTASGGGVQTRSYISAVFRRLFRYASPFAVLTFLYQFNKGHVPGNVTSAFIHAAGGGSRAVLFAQHLTTILGGFNVIMLLVGAFLYSLGIFAADKRSNMLREFERRVEDLTISLERSPEKPRPARTKVGGRRMESAA